MKLTLPRIGLAASGETRLLRRPAASPPADSEPPLRSSTHHKCASGRTDEPSPTGEAPRTARNGAFPRTLLVAALFVGGCCTASSTTDADPPRPSDGPQLPATLMLDTAPPGAKPIAELKAQAQEGDEIVIRAFVGGRKAPLPSSSAVMTVVDASLFNACYSKEDSCAQPWDYCCADRKELALHQATVQVTGPQGRVLRVPLSERVKPGDLVHVTGRVAPRPADGLLVVNARGIYVEKRK